MSVLRENRESLVAVLETFVHDPLCEWARRGSSESSLAFAIKIRETIDRKLQGYMNATAALPLSIPGFVAELIAEATDAQKLASAYIGWAAFM
jgi:serine/threonine-protein kinase ATR